MGLYLRRPRGFVAGCGCCRTEEAAGFGDGDVEPAAAVEPCPPWSDAALSPVTHGALRGADQLAELLEGEQAVVGPVVGDLDRAHGRAFTVDGCVLLPSQVRLSGLNGQ